MKGLNLVSEVKPRSRLWLNEGKIPVNVSSTRPAPRQIFEILERRQHSCPLTYLSLDFDCLGAIRGSQAHDSTQD
jgi:hypothetical protein